MAPDWAGRLADGRRDTLLWLHELCLRLGFDTRRRLLHRRLLQLHDGHPAVRALTIKELVRRGRLLPAFEASRQQPADCDPAARGSWLVAQARVKSELRDHHGALQHLQQARDVAGHSPALAAEFGWAHLAADRIDDALQACAEGLASWPDHPHLLLVETWVLHDANRAEASERLLDVHLRLQSPPIDSALASHWLEHGRQAAALELWQALLQQPHHERVTRTAWRHGAIQACRELGRDDLALLHAEQQRGGQRAVTRLREHLQGGQGGGRVVLPVPFVRQDHMTCSPATMASLLRTFGVVVDQREIAAQITYDGTASSDELRWAQQRGLSVRFFPFDADTARALLDRGLPFAVTTRFETSGHRQAVIGYDRVLDTFVLRDPTGNFRREVTAEWLGRIARRGGECALLLPAAIADERQVPALPGEAETMAWLQLRVELEQGRRSGLEAAVEELLSRATGSLRFEIETRLCSERGDRRRALELWQQRHDELPDDPYWRYHLVAELLDQNRWHEARTRLEAWADRGSSPWLEQMLAEQWRHDARLRPAAERRLRRSLRWLGRDARSWQRLARLLADDGRHAEALPLFRVATVMAPHDEWLAQCHAEALRGAGEPEAAVAFLQERVARLGSRSPAPAGTLAHLLDGLNRPDAAIEVLQQALHSHDTPAGRERLCQALLGRHRHDDARTLMQAAERFTAIDHALCSAQLARATGDRAGLRAALQAAVAAVPSHVEANRQLLEHLLAEDGRAAAIAHAETLLAGGRDHAVLCTMVASFLQGIDEPERAGAVLQRLVDEHPHEHWLRGRLCRHHIARGQYEPAGTLLAELQIATPGSSAVWVDAADIAHARGDLATARSAARRALELAPDNPTPLRQMLNWAGDRDEAVAALRLVMQCLATRPVPPDADTLTHVNGLAKPLPDGELRAWLDRLATNFPGSTAPKVALCDHLLADEPAAALPIAEALVAQEPWLAAHHLRLARCLRTLNRRADERAALQALLQIDPSCGQAHVEIGESLEQEGRLPAALAAFERGLQHSPGHAVLHGMVADAAWRIGDSERALTAVARAFELDPSYAWAADARIRWLGELGRAEEALALAEAQVQANPRWATGHDLHARALAAVGRHDERIAALQRALALSPRLGSTRIVLLDALLEVRRLDEARAVIAAGRELHGDDPALALREAMIARTTGRASEARGELRALLERHPDYAPGWVRLLNWCEEEGLGDEILALHAAPPEALRTHPVLYGYAADVFKQRGDTAAAERALTTALEHDQGYGWARDELCQLLLARDAHDRVLELLPDHTEPSRLVAHHAAMVAKAAAGLGREALAKDAFARLLRDDTLRGLAIGEVDAVLRRKWPRRHERDTAALVRAATDDTAVVLNYLRVLRCRDDLSGFFGRLSEAVAGLTAAVGEYPVALLVNDARRRGPMPGLARWVRRHLRGPVRDTRAAGAWMHALTQDPDCQPELLRLFANDWRRPDIEGWMLANLAGALVDQRRFDEAVAVSEHALEHVPHDHSFWWHRRYLAEAALERGELDRARELSEMQVTLYRGVHLSVYQIDLLARLRQTPYARRGRLLRSALPELFRRYDAAVADDDATPKSLFTRRLLRACPGPTTLLFGAGKAGRRLLRAVLRC